jgi:hypothetical protein
MAYPIHDGIRATSQTLALSMSRAVTFSRTDKLGTKWRPTVRVEVTGFGAPRETDTGPLHHGRWVRATIFDISVCRRESDLAGEWSAWVAL